MSQKKRKSLIDAFVFRDAKEAVDRLGDSSRAEDISPVSTEYQVSMG